jgi:CRP-like cAMP-binding protein
MENGQLSSQEYQPLIDHIQKRIAPTPEELREMLAPFKLKKVKKKQFIIQPEFVPRQRSYVISGSLRAYVVDVKGEDHTIQFAIEDWWLSDFNSYIYQKPATMFVVAMEDSVLLQIEYKDEQALKAGNHKFETFFRIMAERGAAFHQRRIIANLTQTAEERYNNFLKDYPLIVQRVPQYALASYLGMTTEFLSRIRNKKVKQKS